MCWLEKSRRRYKMRFKRLVTRRGFMHFYGSVDMVKAFGLGDANSNPAMKGVNSPGFVGP